MICKLHYLTIADLKNVCIRKTLKVAMTYYMTVGLENNGNLVKHFGTKPNIKNVLRSIENEPTVSFKSQGIIFKTDLYTFLHTEISSRLPKGVIRRLARFRYIIYCSSMTIVRYPCKSELLFFFLEQRFTSCIYY